MAVVLGQPGDHLLSRQWAADVIALSNVTAELAQREQDRPRFNPLCYDLEAEVVRKLDGGAHDLCVTDVYKRQVMYHP